MHFPPGAPDRRRITRGTPDAPRREELVARILGTYTEMPGLALPLPEAPRLLGFTNSTCRVVLNDLVRRGRLRLDDRGRYVRGW